MTKNIVKLVVIAVTALFFGGGRQRAGHETRKNGQIVGGLSKNGEIDGEIGHSNRRGHFGRCQVGPADCQGEG